MWFQQILIKAVLILSLHKVLNLKNKTIKDYIKVKYLLIVTPYKGYI